MNTDPSAEWEQRCAALWDAFDDHDPADFRSMIKELTSELPADHPVAHFEQASAYDATDMGVEAVDLYRMALSGGLGNGRRRQAVIQMASTLRTLGDPTTSADMLLAERSNGSDDLDDAVIAFLALALVDLGREREAAALALGALVRHLPSYTRSLTAYIEAMTESPTVQ
ncbi:tetratricopeptide repeat protein [Actinomadura rubrisoli]|uniref:Tetratricopeptide repeat protein n=1 Tax=Actinomadura rubrisoli TaxID=2530368 RepID=A0A4R5C5Q6_9ACTN|nr:tetratricopeptide repeat protein [Actinomadura rubrisoli]TDD93846.1 tetratricopeptide repeat protein [Actinomadura rubrisoli]